MQQNQLVYPVSIAHASIVSNRKLRKIGLKKKVYDILNPKGTERTAKVNPHKSQPQTWQAAAETRSVQY
jgi:hypothetical protein